MAKTKKGHGNGVIDSRNFLLSDWLVL